MVEYLEQHGTSSRMSPVSDDGTEFEDFLEFDVDEDGSLVEQRELINTRGSDPMDQGRGDRDMLGAKIDDRHDSFGVEAPSTALRNEIYEFMPQDELPAGSGDADGLGTSVADLDELLGLETLSPEGPRRTDSTNPAAEDSPKISRLGRESIVPPGVITRSFDDKSRPEIGTVRLNTIFEASNEDASSTSSVDAGEKAKGGTPLDGLSTAEQAEVFKKQIEEAQSRPKKSLLDTILGNDSSASEGEASHGEATTSASADSMPRTAVGRSDPPVVTEIELHETRSSGENRDQSGTLDSSGIDPSEQREGPSTPGKLPRQVTVFELAARASDTYWKF
ncbi:hypothetical protein ABLN87_21790 [Ruegeria sp. SCPT10]|uniref:hypothetical protein n=1 Tax=Ruegeria sp. SCP10 TaxID=3141377 RepID=UPI00333C7B1E